VNTKQDIFASLNTSFVSAARNGHVKIFNILLRTGKVDVNMVDDDATALMQASWKGHAEIVSALLKAPGIDVNLANGDGCTALMWASRYGYAEIVSALLKAPGIDVNLEWTRNNCESKIVGMIENYLLGKSAHYPIKIKSGNIMGKL
jgi:ankyrin repeat protein